MSYIDAVSAVAIPGTAADAADVWESTTVVVKSAAAPITITAGEIMAVDFTPTGGVKANCARRAAATSDFPVGIALDTLTIPATTAVGDRHVPVKVLRRGFYPAVATTGSAGNAVATAGAVAGRGAGAAVTVANNTCCAIILVNAVANVAPCYVSMP